MSKVPRTRPTGRAENMSPKKAVIAAGLSKEQRKRQRGQIGKLRHQVVSKVSLNLGSFTSWALRLHCPLYQFSMTWWLSMLSTSGKKEPQSQLPTMVVAAIQFYRPECKHHLAWSWKLVKVWNQLEVPQRATPLSPELLMAFAGQAFRWQQFELGWLLVVGFTLFLRTGELLQIKAQDVVIGGKAGVLYMPPSKGGKRLFLPLERVEMAEQITLQAFRALLRHKQPGDLLWSGTRQHFHVPLAFSC